MKTDPDIKKEDIKLIFEDEKKASDAERKKQRRLTRKQAGRGMEVDHHGDEHKEETMDDGGDACFVEAPFEQTEMSTEIDAPFGQQEAMFPQERLKQEDSGYPIKDDSGDGYMADSKECVKHSVKEEEDTEKCVDTKDRVPLPQKECPDIKEEIEPLFFVPVDIPKRNADSEPEDGEVIDDDDDD